MSKRKVDGKEEEQIEEIPVKRNRSEQMNMNAAKVTKYTAESKPPYVVDIWDASEDAEGNSHNLGNLHIQKLGMKFRGYMKSLLHTKKVGIDKVALTFKTYNDANHLIDNITTINPNWRAGVPVYKSFKVGMLLGVDPDLTDQEVEEGLQVYKNEIGEEVVQPTKAVRIKKKSADNTVQNATAIKVYYFREENLPRIATMWFSKISIKPYVPPVRQCYQCYRLGHVKENCRSSKDVKCFKCGKEHDPMSCVDQVN